MVRLAVSRSLFSQCVVDSFVHPVCMFTAYIRFLLKMFLKSLLVLGGVPWVFGKVQYMVC